MRTWIASLKGAVALATVHMLIELLRGFLDFTYVYPGFTAGNVGMVAGIAVLYTLIFAGWSFGLAYARSGSRGGVWTALLLGVLFWAGIDLGTLFFYCPGGCSLALFDYLTWASLLIGGVSLYALFANLLTAPGVATGVDSPGSHNKDNCTGDCADCENAQQQGAR